VSKVSLWKSRKKVCLTINHGNINITSKKERRKWVGDPKLDPGARWGSERPKNRSVQNLFKTCVRAGLEVMNPMQLEWAQRDIVCSKYHNLFFFPNMQKKWWLYSAYSATWQLTVHVVHPYNWCGRVHGADVASVLIRCTNWWRVGQVDQSECDTCHHYKGDTW